MSLTGTRVETETEVTYTYCPQGEACLTTLIVKKSDPMEYTLVSCAAADAVSGVGSAQAIANVDASPVTWT